MDIKFLQDVKQNAAKLKKTIVLPESHDERVLKAAGSLTKDGI